MYYTIILRVLTTDTLYLFKVWVVSQQLGLTLHYSHCKVIFLIKVKALIRAKGVIGF